ncbi:MAG: PKD domain-containing protein, partial [Lewinella sp.]|uniref:PKD domain-containing protein n=1 Tax=Lewinella sp. TaxID=2004506 RepID=UPI003D6B35DC
NFPLANFRTDQDTSDYLGFYFQDLSAYEPALWAWDFGDGGMSQDTSPVHTYLQDGTYEVCLTVSNDNGSHTYCQTLQVGTVGTQAPVVEVEVQTFPNPFPDQFSVVLHDYYPRHAVVTYYTLAGQRIHQQRFFHGWNTVDGTNWPSGIYLYEVWDGAQQLASGKVVKG